MSDLEDKMINDTEDSQSAQIEPDCKVSKAEKQKNRELVKRFPFLIPRNAWSGRKITDGAGYWPGSPNEVPKYDYEYTSFDLIPQGWRRAFGMEMCQEIEDALEADGIQDKYYPVQIKEKYGTLRWYDNFTTEKLGKILRKYEDLSERTCILCGAPATKYTVNWISPYCDDCAQRVSKYDHFISAQEYFMEEE